MLFDDKYISDREHSMKALRYIIPIGGLFFLISCSQAPIAPATSTQHAEQSNQIASIYWSDGDSGRITFNNGETIPFRINNRDAPETGGVGAAIGGAKCEIERELGYASKGWVVEYTRGVDLVITGDHGADRYDRKIIDLSVNDQDLGNTGIELGYYRSWRHEGKKSLEPRPYWCGAG